MTVFSEAVRTTFDRTLEDGTRVYTGTLDSFWSVGAVPHGGYLLAIVLDAVIHSQSRTKQPDPIHLSAHFLLPSRPEAYEVRIREHRLGRRFSNITADLYQGGQMNITTHIIVGTLPDIEALKANGERSTPTILPPHPYATWTPFRQHTSSSPIEPLPLKLTFRSQLKSSNDRAIRKRFDAKAKNPGQGGFDVGDWYEFIGEKPGVRQGLQAIAFLADMGRNTPGILPKADRPGTSWFPTMTLSLEFKVKPSSLPDHIALHTFGVFSTGNYIHLGRHELRSEVWTAPSALEDKSIKEDPNWREKMYCVAISTQMALTIPIEVNKRKADAGKAKPKL